MTALEQAQGSLARASLDGCVKCTICETQFMARVTPLFPGPVRWPRRPNACVTAQVWTTA